MSKYYTKAPRPRKITFGKRPHRGGLIESIRESKKITKKEFEELLPNYNFYCFDQRVNQILFISNQPKNDFYTWIFIQVDQE